jgi:hypothetical protein
VYHLLRVLHVRPAKQPTITVVTPWQKRLQPLISSERLIWRMYWNKHAFCSGCNSQKRGPEPRTGLSLWFNSMLPEGIHKQIPIAHYTCLQRDTNLSIQKPQYVQFPNNLRCVNWQSVAACNTQRKYKCKTLCAWCDHDTAKQTARCSNLWRQNVTIFKNMYICFICTKT